MKERRSISTLTMFCRKATRAGSSSLRTRAKLATSVDTVAAAAGRRPLRSFWAGVLGLVAVRHG